MQADSFEERLLAIETRLSQIEDRLKVPGAAVSAPRPVPAAPKPQLPPAPKHEFKPGNWLGIIAVICFVLAAGFIVKLSIESGWLTPARQIGLAALLGFSLIGAGFVLLERDRAYASLLPGAGVIVLYLTVFAAHRLYGLVSFQIAIALTAGVSALCVILYTQLKQEIYAITAAIGAYVAPVVLGLHPDEVFALYYFVLCSVAFSTISIWLRSRTLTLVSAYLALFMSGAVGIDLGQDRLVAELLALQFVIFTAGTVAYTVHHRTPLKEFEAWSLLPVLLLFYALEYFLIYQIAAPLAPWISLGFAGVLVAFYLAARLSFPQGLGSQSLILAFATIVCFHSVYLVLLPEAVRPWLFAPIILGAAFLPGDATARARGGPFAIPLIALLIIAVIEYATMLGDLVNDSSASLAPAVIGFLSLWAALAFSPKLRRRDANGHVLLGAVHIVAVLGAYHLTHALGSLQVSASWLFYAVAVLVFGYMRKDKIMAQSALVVLGLAAGKALLFDAASAPTVVRIFCLLLTGVVLYGCGLFMRRVSDWDRESEAPAS